MTFMITIMDLDLKSGIWKRFRWLLRKDLLTFFIQSGMAFLSWWNSRFQKRGLVWILMCVPSVQSSDQEKWPTVQIFDLASWCRKLFYTCTSSVESTHCNQEMQQEANKIRDLNCNLYSESENLKADFLKHWGILLSK